MISACRLWLTLVLPALVYRLAMVWTQNASLNVSAFGRQLMVGIANDTFLGALWVLLFLLGAYWRKRGFRIIWNLGLVTLYGLYVLLLGANGVNVYFRQANLSAADLDMAFDLAGMVDSARAEITPLRVVILAISLISLVLLMRQLWKNSLVHPKQKTTQYYSVNNSRVAVLPLLVFWLLLAMGTRSFALSQRVILHEPLETNPVTFLAWRWQVRRQFFRAAELQPADLAALKSSLVRDGRYPLAEAIDSKAKAPVWRNQRPQVKMDPFGFHQTGEINNVVLVLLESMSRTHALDFPDAVPEMTALAKSQGIEFTRHFATAYRTCGAQFSMLCSLYDPPQYYVSRDFPESRFRCLPQILKENGFSTYWITGADAQFDYNGKFLSQNGIDQMVTRSQLPADGTGSSYGLDDSYAYEAAIAKLDSHPEHSFIYLMTTSNHHPYQIPEKFLQEHPQITAWDPITRAYYYADHQLGDFIRRAQTKAWYSHTLFVFAGDHAHWGYSGPGLAETTLSQETLRKRYNTLMLMLVPGMPQHVIGDWDTSHIDIAPTILDILGLGSTSDGMGRNMFIPPSDSSRWLGSQDNNRQSMFSMHRADQSLIADDQGKNCRHLATGEPNRNCTPEETEELRLFQGVYFNPLHAYLREQKQ